MIFGYKCCKKEIRVPSRGATRRRGVWYYYLNIRERGECSGDRVGSGVTWDPVELEGEEDHMEEVGVESEQPQL